MTQPTPASDTIDLGNVVRTLRRGWAVIAGFTLLGVALGVVFLVLAGRKFDGRASILLRSGGSSAGASLLSQVQGLSGGLVSGVGGSSQMQTEVAILQSRAVAARVVDSLRLQARVKQPAGIASASVIDSLALATSFVPVTYHFERASGGARAYRFAAGADSGTAEPGALVHLAIGAVRLKPSAALPASFDVRFLDESDAIDDLSRHLTVDPGKGEVADIAYRADDSITAAAVPNVVIGTYMARRHTSDRGVNQQRVEFLTDKLDSLNGALALSELALRREQEASGVIDPETVGKLEIERAGELRSSLTELQVERTAAQKLIAGVNAQTITPRQLAAFPTFLKSSGVNSVLAQLMDVQSRRDALLGTRTAKDPQVQALGAAANDLEAQLLPLTQTYAASLGTQQQQMQATLDSLQRVIATLPATSQAAGRLQRDVLNLSRLSAAVQVQLVDAKLAAIGEGGDVHPIDVATVPRLPSFPRRSVVLAAGVGAGLALGVLATLLLNAFGRWVRDPMEIERTTGVPALRFDPAAPLLVRGAGVQTLLIAPVEQGVSVAPIVARLLATAIASGFSAAVLNLTDQTEPAGSGRAVVSVERRTSIESREAAARVDVNAEIGRLAADHDLVIVQLSGLLTDTAAAALRDSRPVLLVTSDRRVERSRLTGAIQLLKRLDVPCAGVVMNGVSGSAELPA
jgi:uncharacterized protein involved in exopolysaccharide biosynthesis